MGNDQALALIETDQAAILAAHSALEDLQAIGLILCYQRWTTPLSERFQEDLQKIATGLGVTRRWATTVRSGFAGARRESSSR